MLFAGQSAAEDTCVPVQWGVPLCRGWNRLVFFARFSFSSWRERCEGHPAATDEAHPRLLKMINWEKYHNMQWNLLCFRSDIYKILMLDCCYYFYKKTPRQAARTSFYIRNLFLQGVFCKTLTAQFFTACYSELRKPPFPFLTINSLPPCNCFSLRPSLSCRTTK